MSEKLRETLARGVLAALQGLGICLPLLSLLSLESMMLPAALLTAALSVLIAVASAFKPGRIAVWCLPLAALLVWLPLGGASLVPQICRAALLQLKGVPGAIPLFALPTAVLAAVLSAWLGRLLTARELGFAPSLILSVLLMAAMWLTGQEARLLTVLPGMAASLTLLAQTLHDGVALWRVLPFLSVLTALCFLVTLTGGVTVEPLKEKAEDLRQMIYDYFFYTEPRDVFSLSAEGYYPEGQSQLGGPVTQNDRVVMQVTAPRTVYLRGVARNDYTGRIWQDTTGGRRYLWIASRWRSLRTSLFNQSLPSGKLGTGNSIMNEETVTVLMLSDGASTLFVPQRVRSLEAGGDLVPYFNNSSEIFATRNLQAGDTYTVTASLAVAGDAGLSTLVEAATDGEDPDYESVLKTYTALPDHLESIVKELADKMVQGETTDYGKAFAIQNYLTRNYRYTLDVQEQPADLDFVTNFLFNTQEGYCTYFASAMTVLCRLEGIPARYVEGYLAVPDGNGSATVTGADAHAWTEVYLKGFGWLTFDATPGHSREQQSSDDPENGGGDSDPDNGGEAEPTPTPTPTPESDNSQEEPEDTPTPENNDEPEDTPTPSPEEPSPTPDTGDPTATPDEPEDEDPNQEPPRTTDLRWLFWLIPILLLLAAIVLRAVMTDPRWAAAHAKTPEDAFSVWVQAVFDALKLEGLQRWPGESPLTWMRRLDQLHRLSVLMAPLGEALALVCYAHMTPEEQDISLARSTWEGLRQDTGAFNRFRLALIRFFVPRRARSWQRDAGQPAAKKKKR